MMIGKVVWPHHVYAGVKWWPRWCAWYYSFYAWILEITWHTANVPSPWDKTFKLYLADKIVPVPVMIALSW